MKCEDVQDRLDDYVDGSLGEAEFQDLELHLHGCAACREAEALLRSLLAQAAALPKEMSPPRDLWPEVAPRLGRRSVLPFAGVFARRGGARSPGALAAAAAVIVAVAATLRTGGVAVSPAPGAGPSIAIVEPAAYATEPVLEAEGDYVRATSTLLAALNERRDGLSPETLKAVQSNLRVIDDALKQIREALRKDPGNTQLERMLTSTHQRKVDVLRRVVKLSRI